jgi:plastocyanin
VPDHSDEVSIPPGADPFASYGVDGSSMSTDEQGSTYEYTFETPGEYTYVCVPHVGVGMIGTIVVEEDAGSTTATE